MPTRQARKPIVKTKMFLMLWRKRIVNDFCTRSVRRRRPSDEELFGVVSLPIGCGVDLGRRGGAPSQGQTRSGRWPSTTSREQSGRGQGGRNRTGRRIRSGEGSAREMSMNSR